MPASLFILSEDTRRTFTSKTTKGKITYSYSHLHTKVRESSPKRNGFCDLQEGKKKKSLHLCFNKIENFKLEILNAEDSR